MTVFTQARLEVPFSTIGRQEPLTAPERRLDLLARLNQAGANIPDDGIDRWPGVPFDAIADSMDEFLAVWGLVRRPDQEPPAVVRRP